MRLKGGAVTHDSRLRGQFSETLYQLDAHHQSADGLTSKMGEAKDYSDSGSKVGRGDVQKLAGALPDLEPVHAGAFFSATGYTVPAKKYAKSAASITGGKPIALYELAASSEQDEKGLIKTIVINLHIDMPHPQQGMFTPVFTERAKQIIKDHFQRDGADKFQYQLTLQNFIDVNGNSIGSLKELTSGGYGSVYDDDKYSYGCYWLPGYFINIDGVSAELLGLEYRVPHSYTTRVITITDDSANRIAVRDGDGVLLIVLTDKQIQNCTFDEDGRLVKR
jgi:hypothetical protein